MASQTAFDKFIQDEIENQKGIYVPVYTSSFVRFIRHVTNIKNIHPNPDDEFCFKDVGPSYRIISEYVNKFMNSDAVDYNKIDEPLMVCRVSPKGYMLVNGHHRWAAALKMGLKRVPIKIINMCTDEDIKRMLDNSDHVKRVTLDLDEIVFRPNDYPYLEEALGFPHNIKFRKRMRLGIPALMRYFNTHGYAIWVYSSNFYSIDDVRNYFKYYSISVDGIITGTAKKKADGSDTHKNMEKLIAGKYETTVHLDNDLILITKSKSKDFTEIPIEEEGEAWSKTVMNAMDSYEQGE